MGKPRRPRYFIYRERPFRPLFHRFWFAEPRILREVHRGPAHIWWFLDKALVQRMTKQMNATEPTLFAEERDFVRISGGYSPKPAEGRGPKPSTRAQARNERIDDL